VGIILIYPTGYNSAADPEHWQPRNVQLKWDTFNRHAGFLRSIVYIHRSDPVEFFLRPDEDTFSWQNPARNRLAGHNRKPDRIPAGRAPDKMESIRIATEALRNIYRAFEYRDEERTYDILATSVDGRLLRSLYLQVRKALLITGQGNAQSLIVDIRPVSGLLSSSDTNVFELDFTWRTTGQLEHWEHIHSHRNEYRARLSFSRTSNIWKRPPAAFSARVGWACRRH